MNLKEREQFLVELDESYSDLRKKYEIKTTLNELDKFFQIKDSFLKLNFIPGNLSFFVRSRIQEFYSSWIGYLQNLLFPSTSSLISMSEGKLFSEEEKKEIGKLVGKMMAMISKNSILTLEPNIKEEGEFIDSSVKLWKSDLNPKILVLMKKVNENWKKD
ncbi:Uncharacterised protein [uncultured archaeon]|nr:Uncharacterised protein [uncultured archaeon]